ncbi:tape measure protein [Bifidobacterium tissieri]|nr:tape measure protein [Bifidobacterium tissieri]
MAGGIEVAKAFVTIIPSISGNLQQDITRAIDPAADKAGQSAGKKIGGGLTSGITGTVGRIGSAFKTVAGVASVALAGIGFANIVSGAVEASDATKKFASTLQFAGKSKQEISQLTAEVQKYADETVYDLSDIQSMTAQLASNGVPDFEKLAEAAGNLNAVAGGNAETFKSVGMVMTQTAGAGKLTTENWNQLSDAIPGASGRLQEAMKANGAYVGNFRDAMEKGEITADEFNKAVMQLGMEDVAKQAATSTETFEGAWGNLEAAVQKGAVSIVDRFMPDITNAMNGLGEKMPAMFDTLGGAIDRVRAKFDEFKNWLGDVWQAMQDNGAAQTFKDVWDKIAESIGNFVRDATGLGSSFASMIPPDTVANGLKTIADLLKWIVDNQGGIMTALTGIGGAMAGIKLAKGVTSAVGTFKNLKEAVKLTAEEAGKGAPLFKTLSNAISLTDPSKGGLIDGFGKLAGKVGDVSGKFKTIKGTSKGALSGMKALSGALGLGPWGLLVGAIAAVVAGLVWFFTQTETGQKLWGAFTDWITEKAQAVADFFTGPFVDFFTNAWETIKGGLDNVKQFFKDAWDGVTGIAQGAADAISGVWGGVVDTVSAVWDGIVTAAKIAFVTIATIVLTPFKLALDQFGRAFEWLNTNVFQPVWEAIKTAFQIAWEYIRDTVIQPFINVFDTLGKAFQWLYDNVIIPVWEGIKSTFTNAWNTIKSVVFDAWTNAIDALSKAWQWFKDNVVTPVWEGIKTTFTNAWNLIKAKVFDTWTNAIDALGRAWQWFKDNIVNPVWEGLKTAFQNGWDFIDNHVVTPFKNGMDALGKAVQSMKDMAAKAWEGLKDACAAPVRWVIDTVYTKGVKAVWDSVADAVGLDLKLPDGPKFARGGVMPGYTPGRDVRLAAVSGGEAIMRPEFTKAIGADWVYRMNAIARSGGITAVRRQLARNGMAFADGGVIGTVKEVASDVAEAVTGFISDPAGWVTSKILDPVKAKIQEWTGGGTVARIVTHMPIKWASALVDKAKTLLSDIGGSVSGAIQNYTPSAGVAQWTPQVLQALAMLGQPASWLDTVLRRMNQESGGNPNAINLWDSNAAAGMPSQGLMQTIPPTFNAYAGPLAGRGILDPLANIYAGLNYAIHRYGSLAALNRPGGYKLGGIIPMLAQGGTIRRSGTVMVGEKGPELLHLPQGAQVQPLERDMINGSDDIVDAIHDFRDLLLPLLRNGFESGQLTERDFARLVRRYA